MSTSNKTRDILASNIRKYRKKSNLTQAKLAELADVSNTYIANIECGKTWISDKTLEKIADALHVDVYLFFLSEKDEPPDLLLYQKREDVFAFIDATVYDMNRFIEESVGRLKSKITDIFS